MSAAPARVGGSLRRALGEPMLEAAARWPVCEIVPESWDPESERDVLALENLARATRVELHSLSLNVLGDGPHPSVLERVRFWAERLGAPVVSDHFCWTGMGEARPGVFFPPLDRAGALNERVERARDALGRPLVLENIALSARDPQRVLGYHEALASMSRELGFDLLLDVENLRLDSLSSGLEIERLAKLYDGCGIHAYHVAGGEEADGLVLDTHRLPASAGCLRLLRELLRERDAPVVYERDYDLDVREIAQEVDRIEKVIRQQTTVRRDP